MGELLVDRAQQLYRDDVEFVGPEIELAGLGISAPEEESQLLELGRGIRPGPAMRENVAVEGLRQPAEQPLRGSRLL